MKRDPMTLHSQARLSSLHVRTDLRVGKALGACILDVTHFMGFDKVAEFYTHMTGKDCGCKGRQDWLNEKVPDFFGK